MGLLLDLLPSQTPKGSLLPPSASQTHTTAPSLQLKPKPKALAPFAAHPEHLSFQYLSAQHHLMGGEKEPATQERQKMLKAEDLLFQLCCLSQPHLLRSEDFAGWAES